MKIYRVAYDMSTLFSYHTQLEDKLGVTFAEKLLGLSKEGASSGDLQAIGKGGESVYL